MNTGKHRKTQENTGTTETGNRRMIGMIRMIRIVMGGEEELW
jgi:hypothetical protein